ncbi:P-loop NTPase family protein [Acaryochloris sp. IP29b_bin.137]|uniref:P-loop NTPase family protein n=1 Tax=Acaryochloris sp. IP29b_bin.137 TaxID=2969217 RepID=UPI00261E7518|nr:P-loop NTPase family protein [Acaryochloris sp. IP29b_bin.137]
MVAQLDTPPRPVDSPARHIIEGLVQIFTAPHRSFFTSVMAQALREAGQGTRVLVVQFLKGGINMGHHHPMHLCQHLDWYRCNLPRCIDTPELETDEMQAMQDLWQHTQTAIAQGDYSLVILDELSLALHLDLIPEAEVLSLIQQRPRHIDMILTGPNMPSSLMDVADQITELRRTVCP